LVTVNLYELLLTSLKVERLKEVRVIGLIGRWILYSLRSFSDQLAQGRLYTEFGWLKITGQVGHSR
jgi:hypothetical protein